MKKQNQRIGTKLRRALALTLASVCIAGALPMENVYALRYVSVLREEIERKDWWETEENEELEEELLTEEISFQETPFQETPFNEESFQEPSSDKSISDKSISNEASLNEISPVETLSQEPLFEEALSQETLTETAVEAFVTEEASTEEAESIIEEASTVEDESTIEDASGKEPFGFTLSADNNGIYDYRTHYRTTPYLHITMNEGWSHIPKEDDSCDDVMSGEEEEILFYIRSENESVAMADVSRAKPLAWGDIPLLDADREYLLGDGKIPLIINGIGRTTLDVSAVINSLGLRASRKITIEVKHSPFCDEDFEVILMDENNKEKERFTNQQKWQEYLAEHDNWVNSRLRIGLSETGLRYYNRLTFRYAGIYPEEKCQHILKDDVRITQCRFQMQNSRTGAKAKMPEGIGSFQMGIDKTPPVIQTFVPSEDYYTLTSTENEQYFPKCFLLSGFVTDSTSGIAFIEYTTNMNAENGVIWNTLKQFEETSNKADFTLTLGNGIYNAIAVRAIDKAGNISEPVCMKNESDEFITVIVDDTPPDIEVLAVSDAEPYTAEGENWTNQEIQFTITEKFRKEHPARLYRVEYAYQSIASALWGEAIKEDAWHILTVDETGKASFSVGGNREEPINQNGYYYFRGVSRTGISNETNIEKRILLWQKPSSKRPPLQTNANLDKCHNEWYNIASGVPVIDFEYPKYDTGVISGEYGAPITIHYNLTVEDENNLITSIIKDKTATIHADLSEIISTDKPFIEFPIIKEELSNMQVTFSTDGIYTLEYWITDAAGNESKTDVLTYKIDINAPTDLKLFLADEEQSLGKENMLFYDKFYQEKIFGQASADYGISRKENIQILKAKKIGEWNNMTLHDDAEQFQVDPNIRCLLYIRATDGAGNTTEGWTRGIVVDNEAPTGDGTPELIIEPKGANKRGFFNKDVKVTVSIKDSPTDQNSAALKLVTETITVNGTDHILDKELFSSGGESVSEDTITLSQNFTFVETIDAKANEGNQVSITVNAVDRCENKSTYTKELKIDVTKPEIKITFDNENAVNGKYYSTDRRAKITITELNFDPTLVKINVTKDGADFSPAISEWHSDKNDHYAYLDFTVDGDYTLHVKCSDLADNEAEEKHAEPFTIDKTMPRATITLENSDVENRYFKETQTAVITIVEHNFNADDVWINMQPAGKIGAWEHENDTHVIKVQLLSEGINTLSCEYKDLAGNGIAEEDKAKMPIELVIDKTTPVINITGVENDSANSGEVVPVITVTDTNLNPLGTAITLTTGRGAAVEIASDIAVDLTEDGFVYTLNGLDAKADDIYYLAVNAVDEAGNVSELTYRFSLNRRGSAYDVTDLKKIMENYYNSFASFEDIKIVEMNVDKVEDFTLYLSHNGDMLYGEQGNRSLAVNENALPTSVRYHVERSGNEDTGYVYTYTIYRETFAFEGTYRIGIYSKDRAGNEVNNLLRLNGEEIQFVIDNTMPRVVIEGVEKNEIYDVTSQEVRIVADDNFKLASAELILVNSDNEVLERWDYFDLIEKEGDTAVITIGEYKEELSLLYNAKDAAGNEVCTQQSEKAAKTDFLVTTDKMVQFVNKPTKTSIGRIIFVIPAILGICMTGLFVIVGRKRKEKNIR